MNWLRRLLQRLFPASRAETRREYEALELRLADLQNSLRERDEAMLAALAERDREAKEEAASLRVALEAQRQWAEAAIVAAEASLTGALEEKRQWAEAALEIQRQWQEAFARGELKVYRGWEEASHLASDALLRDALETHRMWEEAALQTIRDISVLNKRGINRLTGIVHAAVPDVILRYIEAMRGLFPIADPVLPSVNYCRIGRHNDGGYVMLDDFCGRSIAYSIGISDDVSWDRAMAERGFDVFMYDHTISALPEDHIRFHFSKIGLCGLYDPQKPELRTLEMLLADNGHGSAEKIILKVDVEGCEWDALNAMETQTLRKFSQIVIEFHDLTNMQRQSAFQCALKKLNETHQLVHLHANNYGAYFEQNGLVLPELLEATYLNRGEYAFHRSDRVFPTELDEKNNPDQPEIVLGKWRVP